MESNWISLVTKTQVSALPLCLPWANQRFSITAQIERQLYNNQAFINGHLKKFCDMNFFQPSVKLVKKIHIGSKLKRIYDRPKTAFQRVCECKNINQAKVAEFKKLFKLLNPFELRRTIDKKIDRIYELHTTKVKIQRTFEERIYAEIL